MGICSLNNIKLSIFHTGRCPYVRISLGDIQATVPADDAAELAGVNRQTLTRWADNKHQAPASALNLYAIVYLGLMPWPGFEKIRISHFQDCYGMISNEWPARVYLEPWRLHYFAAGLDDTQHLRNEISTLRATVTALSTRQPPPIPCAEIIPMAHYLDPKKNPA